MPEDEEEQEVALHMLLDLQLDSLGVTLCLVGACKKFIGVDQIPWAAVWLVENISDPVLHCLQHLPISSILFTGLLYF
jgi:hypothetical protein